MIAHYFIVGIIFSYAAAAMSMLSSVLLGRIEFSWVNKEHNILACAYFISLFIFTILIQRNLIQMAVIANSSGESPIKMIAKCKFGLISGIACGTLLLSMLGIFVN